MLNLVDRPGPSPIFGNGERATRLQSTRFGGKLVNAYWESLFHAKEEGKKVVWYNGTYIPPFFHAHDLAWVHGEAWSAYLAAKHGEMPAQKAGEQRGYDRELCSYARTHIGQVLIDLGKLKDGTLGVAPDDERAVTMAKLPPPDMIINAYPYCSSGQQWDDITYRLFGKKVPMFTVSIPLLWGGRPDAGYLRGEEWEQRSRYVADQLIAMTRFLEEHTGRKYDFDRLSEVMGYVKKAAELRLEAMDLCTATPSPASFFDWIVSIAPVNFLPGDQNLVTYFEGVKAEIEGTGGAGRRRGQGREVPALLRRDDELEQGWLACGQIRRGQRLCCRRTLYSYVVLAGAGIDRSRRPCPGHGAELPGLPQQSWRADHDRRDRATLRQVWH